MSARRYRTSVHRLTPTERVIVDLWNPAGGLSVHQFANALGINHAIVYRAIEKQRYVRRVIEPDTLHGGITSLATARGAVRMAGTL